MTILLVSARLSWGPNCRYQDPNSRQAATSDRSGGALEDADLDGRAPEDADLDGRAPEDADLDGRAPEDADLIGAVLAVLPELPLHAVIVSAAIAVRTAPILPRMNVPLPVLTLIV
jgi:hypothetical protein